MWEALARFRDGFRLWRRSRPFWAGIFGLLAAVAIIGPPVMSFNLGEIMITVATLGGMSSVIISTVISCCAVGLLIKPEFRVACGVVTMVASLISLVNANFGGFVVGLFCGLVSAALALSWAPAAIRQPVFDPEPVTEELPVLDANGLVRPTG